MAPALEEDFVLLQSKASSAHGAHMEPVSSLWCWKACFSLTVVPKKWDWHTDKHLSEKASFSFVTDFPFEGKVYILWCISQLRTIQHSLGKKIRRGRLQQCISCGSFVFTCFFCVYICLDFSHLEGGHFVPFWCWASHREYPQISQLSFMVCAPTMLLLSPVSIHWKMSIAFFLLPNGRLFWCVCLKYSCICC